MQNTAFILNIFSSLKGKRILLISMIVLNAVISIIFMVLELAHVYEKNIDYLIYGVEGFVVEPLLLYGYYHVYT
jgi:hypothetical protein